MKKPIPDKLDMSLVCTLLGHKPPDNCKDMRVFVYTRCTVTEWFCPRCKQSVKQKEYYE